MAVFVHESSEPEPVLARVAAKTSCEFEFADNSHVFQSELDSYSLREVSAACVAMSDEYVRENEFAENKFFLERRVQLWLQGDGPVVFRDSLLGKILEWDIRLFDAASASSASTRSPTRRRHKKSS